MNDLTVGISCYSSCLKICIWDGKKYSSFSQRIINFDDVMFKAIKKLLSDAGYSFKDIKKICVVRGPGRFTAIRSIYTFASVYRAISGCKVLGVDVFGCLAYNLFDYDKSDCDIAVLLHAFRDEFYLSFYSIRDKKLYSTLKPRWLLFDEAFKILKKFKGKIVTDIEEFEKEIKRFEGINFCDLKFSKIIPSNIIRSAFYFKSHDFAPLYIKPAKFEI